MLSTEERWPNQCGWLGKSWKKTSVFTSVACVLRLERYREEEHGTCTRMACKCRNIPHLKKEKENKEHLIEVEIYFKYITLRKRETCIWELRLIGLFLVGDIISTCEMSKFV